MSTLIERLEPPEGTVNMVLDTDTYNEIDDQFALAYALLSEQLKVEAVYAAPFDNARADGPADGMEQSYEEINRILDILDVDDEEFAFPGSRRYMRDEGPVNSPAVEDLIDRAQRPRDDPLYVVPIGAPTNVSSAIQIAPEITENIVVVWLGGQPHYWPSATHFNLGQDLEASQVLFDSGVPLVHVPCQDVSQHIKSTIPEMNVLLEGTGPIGDFLLERFNSYNEHNAPVWSKEIWDLAPLAFLINAEWVPTTLDFSPELTADFTWNVNRERHLVRVATFAKRDPILADFSDTLKSQA